MLRLLRRNADRAGALVGLALAVSVLSPGVTLAAGGTGKSQEPAAAKPLAASIMRDASPYRPDELLVKLSGEGWIGRNGARLTSASERINEMLDCYGFSGAEQIAPGTYKLSAPQGSGVDLDAAARDLRATGQIEYAGPNHIYYATTIPNDEQYAAGQQWGVSQIKAEQAWDISTGADNIVIAILDTGTATDHPDLDDKIVRGYDFVNNDENPYDDNGHGTYTAGIAAAKSNNGRGVTGISWGARIMPVKVLSARGSGSEEDIARGIRWAADNGARIISASLGGDENSPVMADAVRYAADRNVLVVAASGNSPDGNPNYPAGYDSVLAVGATGRSDTFTGFSSWGRYVDVTAPGVGILSTAWDRGTLDYEYGNGTSASCPFVSGVAALVWSVNPSLTAMQVKQIIEDSSDDLGDPGWDEHYGQGRLNAFRALQMAQQGPRPTRTPTSVAQPTATPPPLPTRPAQPTLQVNPSTVSQGTLVSIIGGGFAPNELIDLVLTAADGAPNGIGNAQTGAAGAFRAEVALPSNLRPGKATLTAAGGKSGLRASVELTVTGNPTGNGGQSRIQGVIRGPAGPAGAIVRLKPALGAPGADMVVQTGSGGSYAYTNVAAGIYSLSIVAAGHLPYGPLTVQVDGSAADVKTLDITLSARKPPALDRVPAVANANGLVYFSLVGHTLRGPFLKFWESHGGLAIFGYPLSEEFDEVSPTNGKTYKVQYFERNRFEYHPEFAGTSNEVLMGLLGVDTNRGRTFLPGTAFQGDATHAFFNETRHSLSGPFLKYWQSHGGLAVFGYPISEELVENGYRVQYFERNRFEYHPEFAGTANEVLLGLLGVESVKRIGWIAP